MEKSTVYIQMEDDIDYAIVDKGEKSVIIILKDTECVIYDYSYFKSDEFNYDYLLLKHYEDSTFAYKDFMKLIGKMCKKSIDSKYFSNHIIEDNRMIYNDEKNEHMIKEEEKDQYLDRLNNLNNFIKNNKNKFIH